MSQFNPIHSFSTTVSSSGTAVELNPQPYDNTHTVLIFNPSANNVFLRYQTNTAAINVGNGAQIPATSSLQLVLGPKSTRPSAGAETLRVDASSGSTVINVTYINGTSS